MRILDLTGPHEQTLSNTSDHRSAEATDSFAAFIIYLIFLHHLDLFFYDERLGPHNEIF